MFRFFLIGTLLTASAMPVSSGSDPMRPAALPRSPVITKPVVDRTEWRLGLIRQGREGRLALLNDKLVKVGSRLEGARVMAIGTRQVTLKLADQRLLEVELPSVRLRQEQR